jgi:hypothetical protein
MKNYLKNSHTCSFFTKKDKIEKIRKPRKCSARPDVVAQRMNSTPDHNKVGGSSPVALLTPVACTIKVVQSLFTIIITV